MIEFPFKRYHFLGQSLTKVLFFTRESARNQELSKQNGLLQRLDPRIRTFALMMILLTCVLIKEPQGMALLYFFCVALALFSKIPLKHFLVRTWVFIPLFTLLLAFPALFKFFSPGDPLWSFHFLGHEITLTQQGRDAAIILTLRVATSVSYAVLLSLTTSHSDLFKVLRAFRIPPIFVFTVSMCSRYLILFAGIVESVLIAIQSRVGFVVEPRRGRHLVSWNIANIWNRANHLNEQVYLAMISRGYTGESKNVGKFKTRYLDLIFVFFVSLVCWEVLKYG